MFGLVGRKENKLWGSSVFSLSLPKNFLSKMEIILRRRNSWNELPKIPLKFTLRCGLDPRFLRCVLRFHFFFFNSRFCWLFSVNSASVHYSRTHKFHFLTTFSLKIGLTVLFTHLKIILLVFSVFSFQFQQNKFYQNGSYGPIWYICLKTENYYLKTFVKIRVGEKIYKNTWNII